MGKITLVRRTSRFLYWCVLTDFNMVWMNWQVLMYTIVPHWLHIHCTHTAHTLHTHSTHIPHTLHTHCIHIPHTLHTHCIHIPHTLHTHYTFNNIDYIPNIPKPDLLETFSCIYIQLAGIIRFVIADGIEQLLLCVSMERQCSHYHSIQHPSKTPPVTARIVQGSSHNLYKNSKEIKIRNHTHTKKKGKSIKVCDSIQYLYVVYGKMFGVVVLVFSYF